EGEQSESAQQRQQEHEINRDQGQKAEQHGEEIGRRWRLLPAAEARLGAQLARETHGIAQRFGDLRLAAAGRHAVGEVGGVVAYQFVDLRLRKAGEPAVQGVEEFGSGHLPAPAVFVDEGGPSDIALATPAMKAFHSAFCAASAAWPARVSW